MSYKYSFADNETYNAADVNKITSRLVTSGVAESFENDKPYNLSQFNTAGALIYTSGAVPETVSTLKVVSASDGKVFINPGTAFFSDGSTIEVEAGGHELSFAPGVKNYVYLKNDLVASNTSYPVCSESEPTGDFVPLAEISEAGEITDRRVYCQGKLPGYASNAFYTAKITDTVSVVKDVPESEKTYQIGNNSYRYLLAMQYSAVGFVALGAYSFEDGSTLSFSGYRPGVDGRGEGNLCVRCGSYNTLYFTPLLADGNLKLSFTFKTTSDHYYTGDVPITLYLF